MGLELLDIWPFCKVSPLWCQKIKHIWWTHFPQQDTLFRDRLNSFIL